MMKYVSARLHLLVADAIVVVLALVLINGWEIPTWYLWLLVGSMGLGLVAGLLWFVLGLILYINDPSFEWEK